MKKDLTSEAVSRFYDAVLCLDTPEECRMFFADICTPNELLSISQRYHVAALLHEGKTYKEISTITQASTTTISRVNRLLQNSQSGIDITFRRMDQRKREEHNDD